MSKMQQVEGNIQAAPAIDWWFMYEVDGGGGQCKNTSNYSVTGVWFAAGFLLQM